MSIIEPLIMPWLSRKASSVWVSTSTMALPMAMTSRGLAGMEASVWHATGPALLAHSLGPSPIPPDRRGRPGPSPTASGIGTLSLIPLPTPERAVPDQPSPTATIDADSPYRLPRTVVPSRYDLVLEPDLVAFTFAGTCATVVEVVEPTLTVVCNAIELEVSAASIESDEGTRHEATSITLDEES